MASNLGSTLVIAGVGASAGGIEAMLPLFANAVPGGRIAWVVAQHMAHDGHSDLVTRLIQRESRLPVVLAADGMRLRVDQVHVIPAGWDGRIQEGTIRLGQPEAGRLSTPSVNVLFASIAAYAGKRGVGIVLSGTGPDGTAGCLAIRAAGGLTVVQPPTEALFDGMPSAALRAVPDASLAGVRDIGALLAGRFPGITAMAPAETHAVTGNTGGFSAFSRTDPGPADPELAELLRQILAATGSDFSGYTEDTLRRRLAQRKAALRLDSPEAYQNFIRRRPEELHLLRQMFLVSVSSFFRDPESFAVLGRELAQLAARKSADDPIRVWIPACASGEEAWTLAILLDDLSGPAPGRPACRIIATDLNPKALAIAQAGHYPAAAFGAMNPGSRDSHFSQVGNGYTIRPELRDQVEFLRHDTLAGPPPAAPGPYDLISCRNFLIYLKMPTQEDLARRFHRALTPHGLLFIGRSESLGPQGKALFAPVNQEHRLFRRTAAS